MDLSFYKIRMFRNDFVVFPKQDGLQDASEVFVSQYVAKRRSGIGCTGVIFLEEPSDSGFRISIYDRYGNRLRSISDAVACASRYLIDSGMTDGNSLSFCGESEEDVQSVDIIDSRQLRVRMGVPERPGTGEKLDPSPATDFSEPIVLEGRSVPVTPVEMGAFYLVFTPIPAGWKLERIDERIKAMPEYARYTPVFTRALNPESLKVYSRPRYEPADCVAIVSSAAISAISNGYADGIVYAEYAGSSAFVDWDAVTHSVTATVSPVYVFAGDVHIEERDVSCDP